ncbi:hypothetical protein [Ferrimonas balearica]|uniref:hypothetical protein n=1 Tax=Ferrimonas balearica TaxID=44012 RepID=UPI001C99EF9C|nr:hypothetical protein [Ferrimonas balearica]MBY5991372.1 hypothetical protein [Ferrimonas balearica]
MSPDPFPQDPIYSDTGYSAQPSLAYGAEIDLRKRGQLRTRTLIGHGHHCGQNGQICPDISRLTTALESVERILMEVL